MQVQFVPLMKASLNCHTSFLIINTTYLRKVRPWLYVKYEEEAMPDIFSWNKLQCNYLVVACVCVNFIDQILCNWLITLFRVPWCYTSQNSTQHLTLLCSMHLEELSVEYVSITTSYTLCIDVAVSAFHTNVDIFVI